MSHYTSWSEYEEAMDSVGDWAEGPVSDTYMSQEETEDFEPHTRDRIMEAFENGRGNSIWV